MQGSISFSGGLCSMEFVYSFTSKKHFTFDLWYILLLLLCVAAAADCGRP
jgi:hypothetical protein